LRIACAATRCSSHEAGRRRQHGGRRQGRRPGTRGHPAHLRAREQRGAGTASPAVRAPAGRARHAPGIRHRCADRRPRHGALVGLGSLRALLALGSVTHLSIHSFTPALDGTPRTCDIGLLYDPRRAGEQALALRLQAALATVAPQWRVRRNYPYRGAADGHATLLRRRFGPRSYVALEIEFNQALLRTPAAARAAAATFMAGLQLARPGRGVRARG
jgi:hypothetical protein